MQPASSTGGGSSGRALRKWGPIAAIAAVIVVVVAVVALSGGDDDDGDTDATSAPVATQAPVATEAPGDTTPAPTDAPGDTSAPTTEAPTTDAPTTAPAEITYPLSFSAAAEQGIEVDWGERCDPETGRVAVPDYFAPECFAPFEGDNGGATYQGVTADTIKVVVYQGPDDDYVIKYITDAISVDDTNAEEADVISDMVDYYARFYELYGRTVEIEFFTGSGIATDEVAARADAVRIAEEIKPFAVLGGPALTSAFGDELAANDIVCISCTPGQPVEWYQERDPYVWGIDGSSAQKQAHVLEFIEKQVAGKPAEFAGDPDLQTQERVFGHLYVESSQASADLANAFADGMEAIGVPFGERVAYSLDPPTLQAQASQAIAKLKEAGVTTVVLSTDPVAPRDFTREATAQNYYPEWLVAAATLTDTTAFSRTYDQEQWAHAFGVTQLSARLTPENSGYYNLYKWWTGKEPAAPDGIGVYMPPPALLHSVLQTVGPNLTAETFKEALVSLDTRPGISAPYLSWGEDRGYWDEPDYSGIDDATVIWWDPEATGPDEIRRDDDPGMWAYVDGGVRYLPGEWPTDEKLFDPEGAVTLYDEPPPGEERPDYPSPAG